MGKSSEKRKLVPDVKSSTILVVDDEEGTRTIISFAFKKDGHKILEAADGREAMERCHETLPDLIITDIMMPNVDGNEFVAWFRKNYVEHFVPILIVTARSEIESKVQGLELGADDYLTKPFNYKELQARVQALLRTKVLTENLYARTKELEEVNEELSRVQEELIKKERQLVTMQFAGTAAHSLGQPITSILLNCHILEQSLGHVQNEKKELTLQLEKAGTAVKAIQHECSSVREVLSKLKAADPEQTEKYVEDMTILDLGKES